jgi:hypothetical protein
VCVRRLWSCAMLLVTIPGTSCISGCALDIHWYHGPGYGLEPSYSPNSCAYRYVYARLNLLNRRRNEQIKKILFCFIYIIFFI